ncbi:MAG: cbb3-type cytochrome c oxidase subunit 3 [Sphingomonadaceae bacterium]
MSESGFGFVEGLFLVCGLAAIALVWFLAFRPSARRRMEDHGRIPFRDEEAGEGRNGQA